MVLNPIVKGGAADEEQLLFVEVKENAVTDDVSVVIAADKLFGLVDGEIREAIDARGRQEFDSVRALNPHVRHVVGLVKKNAAFLPGTLFISPVRKLGRHYRIHVRAQLRISQHPDGIAGRLYRFV